MVENIFIFICFLCPLIFFHELGHFFFARLFGVKVEVFSIGFGPKIFNFNYGQTNFAISLIPLGGYVKMYGDDPFQKDQIRPEEKKFSFIYKSKWARFCIVFGGPLANFILAFLIFWGVFFSGENIPELKIGTIDPVDKLYQLGLRAGDKIDKINGESFANFSESSSNDIVSSIQVTRNNMPYDLQVTSISKDKFLEEVSSKSLRPKLPVVIDSRGNYYFVASNSKTRKLTDSLEELSAETKIKEVFLSKIAPEDLLKNKIGDAISIEKLIKIEEGIDVIHTLIKSGLYPLDLVVASISEGSPAEKAGLKQGDVLTMINNQPILSFENLREVIQHSNEKVEISFYRFAELRKVELTPTLTNIGGKEVKTIGVYSSLHYSAPVMTFQEGHNLFESCLLAFKKLGLSAFKILDGFKKLIFSEVSLKTVGGPIAIGKVAVDSFSLGISYFLKLMALISINLGIINLFPIPVLDGGHIMFIFFELINRRPLSQKKLLWAQQFGATILFLLVFVALFNDVSSLFRN